jgi:putative molybdopterin biosynthesis protein
VVANFSREDGCDVVAADPVAEAFRTWMRVCVQSGWVGELGTEVVGLAAAVRRVTAEPVRALWSLPAYRAAAMDGIAVCARDTDAAVDGTCIRLRPDRFDPVDTGDPIPAGRDAVLMREHVSVADDGSVMIEAAVGAGRHVRQVGEDLTEGQIVLTAGHRIRPVDASVLAAAGHTTVRVRRRPVVAIVPTGDEVRRLGSVLAPGEVLDTNSLMLAGLVSEAGGEPLSLPIAPDRPEAIAAAVTEAVRRAELVLIIAGSSAGRDDHTASVVARLGRIAVHGVAMRPGHPVLLGVLAGVPGGVGGPAGRSVPVIGVPGYPVSAERAFTAFGLPLLRRLLGESEPTEDGLVARLGCAVRSTEHLDEYVRMRLARVLHPATGLESLVATPLRRGAGALGVISRTEAVLRIPAGQRGFAAGIEVRPVPVAGAAFAATTVLVSGVCSPATLALATLDGGQADSSVHWVEASAREATDKLSAGLCHAAALRLDRGVDGKHEDALEALVARVGEVTLLEIARHESAIEVLVVPVGAFASPPVIGLRTQLRSAAFRAALLECAGYSGRNAGRETIRSPDACGPVARGPVVHGLDARLRE